MSVVYVAEHLALGRRVALKVLDPRLAEDERFRERFVRESRLAAALEDPNIIPIYEAGEQDGVLFIAMRRVGGTDLSVVLDNEGALDPSRAVHIIMQVANGLDAAHGHGLVHRDVKPGNILIVPPPDPSRSEHVYLSDFGLTKRAASDSGITGTGQFVGTLDYAAPEQFEGRPLDARTDVYSLGCVLYECLTGEVPYRREQNAALMYAHLSEPPPKVTAARPDLDPAIDAVVATAMAKSPVDRYSSAGALAVAARDALAERRAITSVERGAGSPPTPRKRRPRSAVAAGALAAVALVVAVLFLTRGGTSSNTLASLPPFSLVAFDPATGKVVKSIPNAVKGAKPCTTRIACVFPIAAGEGGVWLAAGPNLIRIDERSGISERVAGVPAFFPTQDSIAVGFPTVWVAAGKLLRIDPSTQRVLKPVELPDGNAIGVALSRGSAWVLADDNFLTQIDVETSRI